MIGRISRRSALVFAVLGVLAPVATTAQAERFVNNSGLQPGRFVWDPTRAKDGPVLVVVSTADSVCHVYRNGIEIGISTCTAPADAVDGIFQLEPRRASPASARQGSAAITLTGRLVHASQAARTAAPGAVHVPSDFAAMLAAAIPDGATLVIAKARTVPAIVAHSGVLTDRPNSEGTTAGANAAPASPAAALVVAAADRSARLIRAGTILSESPARVHESGAPIGTHVYSLLGPSPKGDTLLWQAFGLGVSGSEPHVVSWMGEAALSSAMIDEPARAREVAHQLRPGALVIVSEAAGSKPATLAQAPFALITSGRIDTSRAAEPAAAGKKQAGVKLRPSVGTPAKQGTAAAAKETPAQFVLGDSFTRVDY